MKKLFATLLALHHLFIAAPVFAQAQLGAGQVLGNSTASRAPAKAESITAMFDRAFGTTPGSLIQRGTSTWGAVTSAIIGGSVTYVDSGIGACTAVGNGIADDAPAFRACMAQINAAGGGTLGLSCNKNYRFATFASGGTGTIVTLLQGVSIRGCGNTSKITLANGLNSAGTQYYIFYPAAGIGNRVDNVSYSNFYIDNNGANNGGFNYNNINIGLAYCSNILIDNITFYQNPGSQNVAINGVTGTGSCSNVTVRNTTSIDACDVINATCTDHSSVFVMADYFSISGNACVNTVQSIRSTCWEQHGNFGVSFGNRVSKYNKFANIACILTILCASHQIAYGNSGDALTGITLWNDNTAGTLHDVLITGNTFRQNATATTHFHDWDGSITAGAPYNLFYRGNNFTSDVVAAAAGTMQVLRLGRAFNQVVEENTFRGGLGPAIGAGTFAAATSLRIARNVIIDAGQTSTAASKRGILINSGTTILQAIIEGNTILNVASAYMSTCFDITLATSTSSTSWVSTYQAANCASQSSLALTGGFSTVTAAGIPYFQNPVGPMGSTAAVAGAALITDPSSFLPSLSVTPTVGVAGSTVGQWCMRNATSGSQCLAPATGALGSSVVTHPAGTYNVVGDTLTQTLTGKTLTSPILNTAQVSGVWSVSGTWTLPAITLGGTVSGGGNQLNNIIIGTTTPLAGTFTTVQTRGAANQGVDVLNNVGTTQINFRWNGSVGGYFGLGNVAGAITTQLFGEGVSDQYFAPTGAGASFGFNTTTPNNAQTGTVGVVTSNGGFKNSVVAVASLPTCNAANAGLRLTVNNANATSFATTVAGGGANVVPVMCTGAAWIIG